MKSNTKHELPLPIYDSRPPPWVPPSHKSADVGKSCKHKNVLELITGTQVTLVFILRILGRMKMCCPKPMSRADLSSTRMFRYVQEVLFIGTSFTLLQSEIYSVTEALSSQSNAQREGVCDHVVLAQLENIMGEVFARRAENTPAVP